MVSLGAPVTRGRIRLRDMLQKRFVSCCMCSISGFQDVRIPCETNGPHYPCGGKLQESVKKRKEVKD